MFTRLSGYAIAAGTSLTSAVTKPKASKTKPANQRSPKPAKVSQPEEPKENAVEKEGRSRDMALTVRIEINLPENGSQETYDNIFKSIRANLIDE